MQQVFASTVHPSILAFSVAHPSIRPAGEAEEPALGRRLPRLGRPIRASEATPATGPSFLEHLRRLAS